MSELPPTFLRHTTVAASLLLIAGCGPAAAPPGGFPPAAVTVITAAARDVPLTMEYTGQTAGYRETEVRARVSGILLKRNYREGGTVRQGDSLFTIDPAPFKLAQARAAADLGVAEARLQQAQRELARLKPVYEAKAVSQKELDDATSGERIARAETESARARLNEAQLNLEWTRVEAPITGIASRAAVSEGSLVSGPNVLLATVTQTDPMYVIFGVSDRDALNLRREAESGRLKLPADGQLQATVKLSDGSDYARPGVVNFVDVRVNTATGTSESRAEFPNPRNQLRAGEFVRITLSGAVRPAAIVVPQRAVLEGPAGKFVYLVNAESKAEPRPVEVGAWTGDGWVIQSGIKPGDRVIVDGVMKIGPGAPVNVTDPATPGVPQAPDQPAAKPAAKKAADISKTQS
ncbi:MAG: efflux RND transporter periplasmic adaptor subunit [Betaproteobacteria bacterium]|nr:MAG: efflux RND transporter periplasmic adaptor subunit [Betaproteobacteria bacterium]